MREAVFCSVVSKQNQLQRLAASIPDRETD
jgi:hypothetical protein